MLDDRRYLKGLPIVLREVVCELFLSVELFFLPSVVSGSDRNVCHIFLIEPVTVKNEESGSDLQRDVRHVETTEARD
jgi:hypothetical protein